MITTISMFALYVSGYYPHFVTVTTDTGVYGLVGTFVFFLAKQMITIMNLNGSFKEASDR